jgi:hypothetical protein
MDVEVVVVVEGAVPVHAVEEVVPAVGVVVAVGVGVHGVEVLRHVERRPTKNYTTMSFGQQAPYEHEP